MTSVQIIELLASDTLHWGQYYEDNCAQQQQRYKYYTSTIYDKLLVVTESTKSLVILMQVSSSIM